MWYTQYRKSTDMSFEHFLLWLECLEYSQEIDKEKISIKIMEIGDRLIVVPKELYMRMFLRIGRGYNKRYRMYRTLVQVTGKLYFAKSYEKEGDAAKSYVAEKIKYMMKEFSEYPTEMLKECAKEFKAQYYKNYSPLPCKKNTNRG